MFVSVSAPPPSSTRIQNNVGSGRDENRCGINYKSIPEWNAILHGVYPLNLLSVLDWRE